MSVGKNRLQLNARRESWPYKTGSKTFGKAGSHRQTSRSQGACCKHHTPQGERRRSKQRSKQRSKFSMFSKVPISKQSIFFGNREKLQHEKSPSIAKPKKGAQENHTTIYSKTMETHNKFEVSHFKTSKKRLCTSNLRRLQRQSVLDDAKPLPSRSFRTSLGCLKPIIEDFLPFGSFQKRVGAKTLNRFPTK